MMPLRERIGELVDVALFAACLVWHVLTRR